MSAALALIDRIASDLERRQASLAPLGTEAVPSDLRLTTPEAMQRYADVMAPQINAALAAARYQEWICVGALIVMLIATLFLSVRAYIDRAGWSPEMAAIPGPLQPAR